MTPLNILWIHIEDMSPWMPLWGDHTVETPSLDRLASRGTCYLKCFSTSPVCSPARSGLITGCLPTRIGVHQHVSSRPLDDEPPIHLPSGISTVPERFRKAGFYTYNAGKDDYNFIYRREDLYAGEYHIHGFYGAVQSDAQMSEEVPRVWTQWRNREPGKPFFGQIGLWGGKSRQDGSPPVDPESVPLHPVYPDHPSFRNEAARHYECIRIMDRQLGEILDALHADGLTDSTAIFLFSDHGMTGLRHKQFCYDGGTHVPLVITIPGQEQPGSREEGLVCSLDVTATTLAAAGLEVPEFMDSRNLLMGPTRDVVVSARDRCDFTIDHIRSVRTPRFRYIRNYLTDRPYLQPQYRDHQENFQRLRKLWSEGQLPPHQSAFAGDVRPDEELYDHNQDPHELFNVVADPDYAEVLRTLRERLEDWRIETGDRGGEPESCQQLRSLQSRWGKDRCVNPEYGLPDVSDG